MKLIKILSIIIIFLIPFDLFGQDLKGKVFGIENNKKVSLENANVYWQNTEIGVITDKNGQFSIKKSDQSTKLIISFLGFKNDTIQVDPETKNIAIKLQPTLSLNEVEVKERKHSSFVSKIEPIHTQKIDGHELKKAACCNLSESFETNASVDVHYADAVTGAKQIQLLGLAGKYSQIMAEKVPLVRGLSTPYGLGYIPGSWMESIQVSKGTATVESGFESITGQINVEYKKPDDDEKFYFNALASDKGKTEFNTNTRIKFNEKWSTGILLHGEQNSIKHDNNKDSFLDLPMIDQINVINRWKYFGEKFMTQFGIKYLEENRYGGQMSFDKSKTRDIDNGYGIGIQSKRSEIFHKAGYMFNRPATSLAFIHSGSIYDQKSYFGLRNYDGIHKSYNANFIFQTYINNTDHKISTGLSYIYDEFDELLSNSQYKRIERIPGAYFQYTYIKSRIFTTIAGIRVDHNNLYGLYITPRIHSKYNINEDFVIRASAGKGYRTANIFAENTFVLSSSRSIEILDKLEPEEAYNYGVSVSKDFHVADKDLTLNLEFYRTDFINQIVVDMDADISEIRFYNLDGKSYSNSYQVELVYEPIKRFDITAAIRFSDVKTTINNQLIEKPLVNRYKGLIAMSYITNLKKWQFDMTTQFNGDGRLPSTEQNPVEYQKAKTYPAYTIVNAQVTKYFKKWNVYFGVENLTNFTQDDPIIASNDPYGQYFDASMIWGPLVGRKFYLGFRLILE